MHLQFLLFALRLEEQQLLNLSEMTEMPAHHFPVKSLLQSSCNATVPGRDAQASVKRPSSAPKWPCAVRTAGWQFRLLDDFGMHRCV